MFLEISQNSQENTCARVSFLMKLQAWGLEITFKNFQEICSALANHIPSNFLKSVFHKFCLVHSWILCPICLRQCHVLNSKKYWLSSHDKPLFIKLSKSRVSLAVSLPSIWFSQTLSMSSIKLYFLTLLIW